MFYKKVLPSAVLLACMPFFSAHAQEEKADKAKTSEPAAVEGVVDFKTTQAMITLLYKKGDYEQAFEEIQRARQRPLGTPELVMLSLYEGIIMYELNRHVESGDAFEMALLIRPEAKLPIHVSPKISNYFETLRRRIQQERIFEYELNQRKPKTAPAASGKTPSECLPVPMASNGRTLKEQQLWRLASMDRMLCARGIRGSEVTQILAELRARVTEASTGTEWMRLGREIEQFSHKYSVYPSNDDWRRAKLAVPEAQWELGDEDQDVLLPEAPPVCTPSTQPEEPANLFGCRAAVVVDCDRLMRRLLLLQNQTLDMDAPTRVVARKELYLLGQRIREANSSETLEEVSDDIDTWQGKWP